MRRAKKGAGKLPNSASGSALDAALLLSALRPGEVALSCGIPGCGKTRTTARAAELSLENGGPWSRAVVFDPYAIRDRKNFARGDKERFPWWPGSQLRTVEELLREPHLLDADPLRLVVCGAGGTLNPQALGRDFSALAELLWHTGSVYLIAEECGIYGREAVELVNRIATGGAHASMALALICQSMGRVPKDGRRGISMVIAGAQGEVTDYDDLRSRCGPQFASRVRSLTKGDLPEVWRLGDAATQEQNP
jgi:hypothetical protein